MAFIACLVLAWFLLGPIGVLILLVGYVALLLFVAIAAVLRMRP